MPEYIPTTKEIRENILIRAAWRNKVVVTIYLVQTNRNAYVGLVGRVGFYLKDNDILCAYARRVMDGGHYADFGNTASMLVKYAAQMRRIMIFERNRELAAVHAYNVNVNQVVETHRNSFVIDSTELGISLRTFGEYVQVGSRLFSKSSCMTNEHGHVFGVRYEEIDGPGIFTVLVDN